MMIKYTLYAEPGACFSTRAHFLTIGTWLQYCPDKIILEHGLMSEREADQIRKDGKVNLYQNTNLKTVSIYSSCSREYANRVINKETLLSYIGSLFRIGDNLFKGRVEL